MRCLGEVINWYPLKEIEGVKAIEAVAQRHFAGVVR